MYRSDYYGFGVNVLLTLIVYTGVPFWGQASQFLSNFP